MPWESGSEFEASLTYRKFQDSQGYLGKLCLENPAGKREREKERMNMN